MLYVISSLFFWQPLTKLLFSIFVWLKVILAWECSGNVASQREEDDQDFGHVVEGSFPISGNNCATFC
jgi:hypothetical protein